MVSKSDLLDLYTQNPQAPNPFNRPGMIDFNDPNVPMWQKYGFSSEAQFLDAYKGAPGGVPGATPAPPAPSTDFTTYINENPDRQDAYGFLLALMNTYELPGMDQFIQDQMVQDRSADEILLRLKTTDQYQQRFKVIVERQKLGLPPVDEAHVINYEHDATEMMRRAGFPSGFWDSPDDFLKLQVADVSLDELKSRISNGFVAAMQMPQDVRDQWKSLGYTDGDLAAYMIDPDRTESAILEQTGAVQQAAQAQRGGFGQLTRQQAEQLQKLGITNEQAQQGFSGLNTQRELMNALPGGNETEITKDQQLQAAFANNVDQQRELQRRAAARAAAFQNGTQFASNKEGYVGVGAAR